MEYLYIGGEFRAGCIKVVDGDTIDALIDCGFHNYHRGRVRLFGINAFELHSSDTADKKKAEEAKLKLMEWLLPRDPMSDWNLRLKIVKADPDSFGRWLAEVWWRGTDGVEHHVNKDLLKLHLAVPFKP